MESTWWCNKKIKEVDRNLICVLVIKVNKFWSSIFSCLLGKNKRRMVEVQKTVVRIYYRFNLLVGNSSKWQETVDLIAVLNPDLDEARISQLYWSESDKSWESWLLYFCFISDQLWSSLLTNMPWQRRRIARWIGRFESGNNQFFSFSPIWHKVS